MKVTGTIMSASERGGQTQKGTVWRRVSLQFSEKPSPERLAGEFEVVVDNDQAEHIKNPKALGGQQAELALTAHKSDDYGSKFTGHFVSKIPLEALQPAAQTTLGASGKGA